MNEQALNKKRAEWAGFTYQDGWWYYPDGIARRNSPRFPQSLDACFKWLIPKLQKQLPRLHHIGFGWTGEEYICYLNFDRQEARFGQCEVFEAAETPALALCLVIDAIVDLNKKGGDNDS